MGSLDRNIPKFSVGHVHKWCFVNPKGAASPHQKEEEKIYEKCSKCNQGRLIYRQVTPETIQVSK